MINLSRWKIIVCVLATVFGIAFTAPNLMPQKMVDSLPVWVPHKKLNLGLDLQGGSSLLYEVDVDALKAEKLSNLLEDVRNSLRETLCIPCFCIVSHSNLHNESLRVPFRIKARRQQLL